MNIKQFVDAYVRENNTTKEALAEKAGIGRTSFFSKLRGASEFSLSEGYALSRILGITTDELYEMTTS